MGHISCRHTAVAEYLIVIEAYIWHSSFGSRWQSYVGFWLALVLRGIEKEKRKVNLQLWLQQIRTMNFMYSPNADAALVFDTSWAGFTPDDGNLCVSYVLKEYARRI